MFGHKSALQSIPAYIRDMNIVTNKCIARVRTTEGSSVGRPQHAELWFSPDDGTCFTVTLTGKPDSRPTVTWTLNTDPWSADKLQSLPKLPAVASGFLSFPAAQQPNLGLGRLTVEVSKSHSDTHTHTQPVGLLWTSDKPDTETSTWQHTTLTRDRHPCLRWDSNLQSQHAKGCRPTP
jgi:hypothetical protein